MKASYIQGQLAANSSAASSTQIVGPRWQLQAPGSEREQMGIPLGLWIWLCVDEQIPVRHHWMRLQCR